MSDLDFYTPIMKGPGMYSLSSGMGSQIDSKRATSSTMKFGSSDRESATKLYLPGQVYAGANTPGPGTYGAQDRFTKVFCLFE